MSNPRILLTAVALLACRIAHGDTAIPAGSVVPPGWAPAPEILAPLTRDAAPAPVLMPRPQVIRGNDLVIAPPKNLGVPQAGQASAFRFEDAPLVDVVHIILRDILKVDYVVHSQIAGNVTLATRGDVSGDQAAYLLESALQANGVALVRDTRGVYHVGRPEALQGIVASPRLAGSGVLPPGSGTVIVPLKFIGAPEMATILRPLLPPNALLRVDPVRNLLVLAGSRTQAEGWLDIVATFDVDLLKGMSVGVFPLKYASVREVETALRMMATGSAPATSATPTRAPGAGALPGAAPAAAPVLAENNPLFGALRVMPLERINSLLIVTPRAAYLDEARMWIERLDRPGSSASEPQLHIYPVKNGSAAHLANVLNGIFGGEGGSPAVQRTGPSVAPGLTSATGATGAVGGAGGGRQGLPGAGQLGQPRTPTATTIQGARVMADELNNAVLVYSLPSEYVKIEATLRRLDLPPTQVLIEASIIEVTLGDDLQYGLQWYFTDKARDGLVGTGAISQGGGILGGIQTGLSAGFSYTLRNSLGQVRAVLNALADKSLVKVISSPSLMVLDNHTAAIAVGNQQPIRSSETVTSGGNVSTSIQYKDTGVNLQVTPSVSAENIVTMQINQAVTDVGQVDAATQQRSFLQRQISSKVAVRSGETLVLGGLIRDNDATGRSGLPLLSNIPILGALFGTQTRNFSRTELLVVITPRVVRTDIDIRDVGADLRERMKGFSGNDMLLRP